MMNITHSGAQIIVSSRTSIFHVGLTFSGASATPRRNTTETPSTTRAALVGSRAAVVRTRLARPPGVCARTHAHTHRNACGRRTRSLRSCPALRFLPPALPSSSPSSLLPQFRTVYKKIANDPQNLGHVFRSPQTLRVCGELMNNISATRGRPDMRFCVCGSPREDLSHIASLTFGCSLSDFFRRQSESSRPERECGRCLGRRIHGSVEDTKLSTNKQHSLSLFIGTQFSNLYTAVDTPVRGRVGVCIHVGGRTDTENRLSENHL
jgi:hypothetical protein